VVVQKVISKDSPLMICPAPMFQEVFNLISDSERSIFWDIVSFDINSKQTDNLANVLATMIIEGDLND
jgi:hypothetical protein